MASWFSIEKKKEIPNSPSLKLVCNNVFKVQITIKVDSILYN